MFEKIEHITHIAVLGLFIAVQAYIVGALIYSFF